VSLPVVLGVAVLGGLGAVARLLLDGAVSARLARSLPLGTLAVNLTGAFALGVLAGAAVEGDALRLAGLGLLGSYTTFSTWMLESHRLAEDGALRLSLANLAGAFAAGLGAAALGHLLGGVL
jgi:fluoride exporter